MRSTVREALSSDVFLVILLAGVDMGAGPFDVEAIGAGSGACSSSLEVSSSVRSDSSSFHARVGSSIGARFTSAFTFPLALGGIVVLSGQRNGCKERCCAPQAGRYGGIDERGDVRCF